MAREAGEGRQWEGPFHVAACRRKVPRRLKGGSSVSVCEYAECERGLGVALSWARLKGAGQASLARSAILARTLQDKVDRWCERLGKGSGSTPRQLLPVYQLVGGKRVQLVSSRGRIGPRKGPGAGPHWKESLRRLARQTFVPENVSSDYWAYARWRFLQRISAAVLSVYSTECMLRAVGVGAKRSLPTAAAFNWLLKDGIGKLGKLGIVAKLGSQYDLELKKFRLLSTAVCDLACGLEMLTPLWPQNFLLLASIGNVGKSVGLSVALATQPAFHKKFALADNMADITAKSQAQHVVADTLGLGLALGVSHAVQSVSPQLRLALPVLSFPILAACDVLLVRNELRAIQLRTLNRDRCQLIASDWVTRGRRVPCPAEVSKVENITFFPFSPEGGWPLEVSQIDECFDDPKHLARFLGMFRREEYMLVPEDRSRASGHLSGRKIRLVFGASAGERAMLKGVLQAAYFRALEGEGNALGLEELVEKSRELANQNARHFERDVRAGGWQTGQVLLHDSRYKGYVVESDWKKRLG